MWRRISKQKKFDAADRLRDSLVWPQSCRDGATITAGNMGFHEPHKNDSKPQMNPVGERSCNLLAKIEYIVRYFRPIFEPPSSASSDLHSQQNSKMGTATWVVPVAVLSGICGIGFIFFWWWCVSTLARCILRSVRVANLIHFRFPKMWKKGTKQEMEILRLERAERDRFMQQRAAEMEAANESQDDVTAKEAPAAKPATPTNPC